LFSIVVRVDYFLIICCRFAEILYSWSVGVTNTALSTFPVDVVYNRLTNARRQLALFQHHDGITGTAKDATVIDYGERWVSVVVLYLET
jgi:alpha-mannosidase II